MIYLVFSTKGTSNEITNDGMRPLCESGELKSRSCAALQSDLVEVAATDLISSRWTRERREAQVPNRLVHCEVEPELCSGSQMADGSLHTCTRPKCCTKDRLLFMSNNSKKPCVSSQQYDPEEHCGIYRDATERFIDSCGHH